jgi:hypothetical protein
VRGDYAAGGHAGFVMNDAPLASARLLNTSAIDIAYVMMDTSAR